ncbi:acyltransferase [Staphylococcus sp. SQ8-PEA]|uniref:Acyltransferase n=1 Tax=Staphylococcus marylandisciuri TaxID=2981529 RepID=A0ABT2QPD8_9STAP|nr:acyltransferase [Staphylococcus marylandisciuri]MCU5745845.1 acyltransferase [Staphylococcus marylandisciuri]
MKRRLRQQQVKSANPLWKIFDFINFFRLFKNTVIIEIARYIPSMKLKRWVYIHLLKMKVGNHTAFAFKVVPDLLHPEYITVGCNCVIGYHTTILTHEITVDSYREGFVEIGDHTLIGANVTILPGVKIGSHVRVSAGTVVTQDIPDYAIVYGNPMNIDKK